jgi:hypothetical protein
METELLVYEPTGRVQPVHVAAPPRLKTLRGINVGIIDNTKPNFDLLAKELGRLLQLDSGVANITIRSKRAPSVPATDETYDELARTSNLVFAGSGD